MVRGKITFYPVAMDIEICLLTVVVREHVDTLGHCAIYNWLYPVFDQLGLYSGCLRSNTTTDCIAFRLKTPSQTLNLPISKPTFIVVGSAVRTKR